MKDVHSLFSGSVRLLFPSRSFRRRAAAAVSTSTNKFAKHHDNVMSLAIIEYRNCSGVDRYAIEFGRSYTAASMIRVDNRDLICGTAQPPLNRKLRPHCRNARSNGE